MTSYKFEYGYGKLQITLGWLANDNWHAGRWMDQEPLGQAVAGAIKASQDYSSGLIVSVHRFGAGRFILNTLLIRENLDSHPAAERLLRNLIRFAAAESAQPVVDLPADFEGTLKSIGYR